MNAERTTGPRNPRRNYAERAKATAMRRLAQFGYLNCFATVRGRRFVISSKPLDRNGRPVDSDVGCALLSGRNVELVEGDSFSAAYRLARLN
jgi:hypothetical protein